MLIPLISCRQGEIYFQSFSLDGKQISEAQVLKKEKITEIIEKENKAYVFGEGAKKELNIINEPLYPDAETLLERGLQIFDENPAQKFNARSLEPLYLSPPLAKRKKDNN